MTTGEDPGIASWPTGRLLAMAARLVEQRWVALLDGMGLSHAGLITLHTLRAGSQTQRALAKQCRVTDQTMSRTLDRLHREGFVSRAIDPADGRRLLTTITPAGEAVLERARLAEREDPAVLGALGENERFREQLLDLIGTLNTDD